MQAWRIAKEAYALDRTGIGGLYAEGRWHQMGLPAIYAGLTAEIAVLEKLVHTAGIFPTDLVLVELTLPDDNALYERLDPPPPNWAAVPPDPASIDYGSAFLRSVRALGLVVPSSIVPEARNILLNPLHPAFAGVGMRVSRRFEFDPRLGGN